MEKLIILLLEDNNFDAELIKEEIASHKIDFVLKLVDTKQDFEAAIHSFQPNLILSDYNLPQFTGFEALEIAKKLVPDIPFILVTGHLSEELAADAIKRGAWDYVLKENLVRLGPAIENTIKLKEEKDKNKVAEKELIKLSSAVKQSANTIVITDIDGNIEYTNPKFTSLTGYTPEEALGKNPSILNSGEQPKAYYTNLWETIKAGETWKGEFHNKAKNGDLFWEQATISPIKDANGEIINYLAIKEDITDRKKIAQQLVKSEKLNRAVTQTAADAIITTNIEGVVTSWNNAATQLFGYSFTEIIKTNINKIIPLRYLKSHEIGLKKHKVEKDQKVSNHSHELFGIRKDGTEFPIELSLSNWEVDNQRYITSIIRDITNRKKSELILKESEHNLLEAQKIAQIGSFNLDLKSQVSTTSLSFDNIIEIDSEKKLAFKKWRTYTHPEDSPENQKMLDRCIKLDTLFDREYRIITKNTQKVKWIHGLGKVIYEKGVATNFVGTIQDITERKKAEVALQKAYSEVELLKHQLEEENISLKEEISLSFNYEDLVYTSVEISDILSQVEQVSNTDATVLLLGETGTGKELIAKAIHNISERKKEPLIYVNCAAIPSELIESELFGHKKGAFTGAINNRIGKFQLADKGTLFLDEIGEMPLELQPKLLRAIQDTEITPVGGSKVIKLDIRIIVATNKNLEKEVDEKRFREDLFFRLNVFPITIPPLRQRIEDIPVLVDHFLNKFSKKYRKEIKFISAKTLQQLKVYPWPGNVRELENLVERAVITSNNERLVFQEFDNPICNNTSKRKNKHATLEEIQSNHIIKTLNLTQWKISGKDGAASLLDIKPSTLRDRMKKFGIVKPK